MNNKSNGYGISWKKSTGEKHYEGWWKNGKPHGFGKGYHKNCENHPNPLHIGQWETGLPNKNGAIYHKNGKLSVRGNFNNFTLDTNSHFIEYKETGLILELNLEDKNSHELIEESAAEDGFEVDDDADADGDEDDEDLDDDENDIDDDEDGVLMTELETTANDEDTEQN
jgi:hypothetical protein